MKLGNKEAMEGEHIKDGFQYRLSMYRSIGFLMYIAQTFFEMTKWSIVLFSINNIGLIYDNEL